VDRRNSQEVSAPASTKPENGIMGNGDPESVLNIALTNRGSGAVSDHLHRAGLAVTTASKASTMPAMRAVSSRRTARRKYRSKSENPIHCSTPNDHRNVICVGVAWASALLRERNGIWRA
jgi:hypothetical protein